MRELGFSLTRILPVEYNSEKTCIFAYLLPVEGLLLSTGIELTAFQTSAHTVAGL